MINADNAIAKARDFMRKSVLHWKPHNKRLKRHSHGVFVSVFMRKIFKALSKKVFLDCQRKSTLKMVLITKMKGREFSIYHLCFTGEFIAVARILRLLTQISNIFYLSKKEGIHWRKKNSKLSDLENPKVFGTVYNGSPLLSKPLCNKVLWAVHLHERGCMRAVHLSESGFEVCKIIYPEEKVSHDYIGFMPVQLSEQGCMSSKPIWTKVL